MNRPSSHSDSKLEKAARTLRHANELGGKASHRHSVNAQHELEDPEHAKARPRPSGESNAGNDGGA